MVLIDVIYISSLLVCVLLGSYFRSIEDIDIKRNYGAGLGMLIICLVCRQHFHHSFFMVWGNIVIIKCCDRRFIHQLSLAFTWLYLLYMYFSLEVSKYVIWIYQGLALRLVGMAFELYMADKSKPSSDKEASSAKVNTSDDVLTVEPSTKDMITYAFFFIGIHKGPYYKLKVFNDYFNLPFAILGDCRVITEDKLKRIAMCAAAYFVLALQFPSTMYAEDDFYTQRGSEYRFLYNIPHLLIFFLEHQMFLSLCTCICTETGFGIYPTKWLSIPGLGPMNRHNSLTVTGKMKSFDNPDQEYNFSMIRCFNNELLLMGPMMKDSVRGWDMPTQYWFRAYIHKTLLRANKEVRSASSFLAWTFWFGPTLGHIIMSATLWLYIHLEEEYSGLHNTSISMKMAWDIGYSIMRMLCLIYLTPCLILHNYSSVVRYYGSIYWSFHGLLLVLTTLAVTLHKPRRRIS